MAKRCIRNAFNLLSRVIPREISQHENIKADLYVVKVKLTLVTFHICVFSVSSLIVINSGNYGMLSMLK